MKQIFALLLSALLMFPNLAAAADPDEAQDSWVVHRYKNWIVEYVIYNDQTALCLASFRGELSSFIIFSNGRGSQMKFWDPGSTGSIGGIEFLLKVDRRTAWLIDGEMQDGALWADLTDKRLLDEIVDGRVLRLYTKQGKMIYDYSLAGSKAAIFALADCVNKL